jgi:hypothetical protein
MVDNAEIFELKTSTFSCIRLLNSPLYLLDALESSSFRYESITLSETE